MSSAIDSRYETRYSEKIAGNASNHKAAVMFDHSPNGYIGITSYGADGRVDDRVLLTPAQAKALVQFIESRGR